MPETGFTESEAILYAVRDDVAGLRDYLADRERFTEYDLRELMHAAGILSDACSAELRERRS